VDTEHERRLGAPAGRTSRGQALPRLDCWGFDAEVPTSTPPTSTSTPHAWRARVGGVVAALLMACAMAYLWGFTVDDALITARVASHLARGLGYRFNAHGPVVDAVTPLGFAFLLAPFARSGPLAALSAAKWLGALSVLAAAFVLGRRVLSRTSLAHGLGLVACLALTAPLGAWAVAGMETGLVTALAVAALGKGPSADLAAALAAAFRPELAPWCICLRFGLRLNAGSAVGRAAASAGGVLAAVVLVGLIRTVAFGRAAPLSVFAKPSDLEHGASYALHAYVQTGLPLLGLAPISLWRGARLARVVVLSGFVHFGALALAGGDWMSLYRLAVPVLPSFVLGAAELWRVAPVWASWLRLAVAGAMSVYLAIMVGPTAAGVGPDRARLIEAARGPLGSAKVVAALDVGWVGAVGDFTVVDLAGVTDEAVAMLPGGHTSKRIDDGLMRSRSVDALVLLAYPPYDELAREVERRAAMTRTAETFRIVARLPFAGGRQHYLVLRPP